MFVHADPDDRSKVIETYTFTVKYQANAENNPTPAAIEIGTSDDESVTVGATSHALQHLLQEILKLCESLPILPRRCPLFAVY